MFCALILGQDSAESIREEAYFDSLAVRMLVIIIINYVIAIKGGAASSGPKEHKIIKLTS